MGCGVEEGFGPRGGVKIHKRTVCATRGFVLQEG